MTRPFTLAQTLALFACCVSGLGCSTAPSIRDMQSDPKCHAWARGPLGHAGVMVTGDRSQIYGTFGKAAGAYYVDPTTIEFSGPFGRRRMGTYEAPKLTIHGALGDVGPLVVGPERTVVTGGLADLVVEYNQRCSDREAALGVVSLVVVAASQNH
jgi:hypothetical protein